MKMLDVPAKIYNIFESLKYSPYNGDIKCKHFSVAIRKGKIVTPVSCNYHRVNVFGKTRGTMHAEMNATNYLINMDGGIGFNKQSPHNRHFLKLQKKMSKTDILVFRSSPSGVRYSKPCSDCIHTMKRLSFRRVYYSLNDGSLVCEKISQISSDNRAQMTRHLDGDF